MPEVTTSLLNLTYVFIGINPLLNSIPEPNRNQAGLSLTSPRSQNHRGVISRSCLVPIGPRARNTIANSSIRQAPLYSRKASRENKTAAYHAPKIALAKKLNLAF
jgi:hypothetical protein